jgi:DNA-binding IclR family transcriptional regulator
MACQYYSPAGPAAAGRGRPSAAVNPSGATPAGTRIATLEEVRRRGYGIDDEAYALGLASNSVPLPLVGTRHAPLAVSVGFAKARDNAELRAHLVADMHTLVDALARNESSGSKRARG